MQCSRVADAGLAAEKMDVLYGEADTEVRERVASHLGECPACREEMAGLQQVRRQLGAWTLDERREGVAVSPRRAVPRWLLAAATLVLGVGMAVALAGQASLRREIAAHRTEAEERARVQRQQIAALRAELGNRPAEGEAAALLDRIDERLEARIRQSEERQDRRLDATLAEWSVQTDAQRRVDMARIAAGLSYLDGRHGQQLARTNELMGYVLETAAEKGAAR
jgi:hypothetical protein